MNILDMKMRPITFALKSLLRLIMHIILATRVEAGESVGETLALVRLNRRVKPVTLNPRKSRRYAKQRTHTPAKLSGRLSRLRLIIKLYRV